MSLWGKIVPVKNHWTRHKFTYRLCAWVYVFIFCPGLLRHMDPLCKSEVYSVMIKHFYTLQNDYHNKSSYHLSPYRVTNFFLMMTTFKMTAFLMLLSDLQYSIIGWSCHAVHYSSMTYFITGSLYPLIHSTRFAHPATALPPGSYQLFSVSMSFVLFIRFCM